MPDLNPGRLVGRATLCALACAVLAAVAAVPASAASWSGVEDLTPHGEFAEAPRVGSDAAGAVIAAWVRQESPGEVVEVAERERRRRLVGAAVADRTVGGLGALTAGGGRRGRRRGGDLGDRRLGRGQEHPGRDPSRRGQLVGAAHAADAESVSQPQIGIDRNGNVLASWTSYDGTDQRIDAASLPAGGSWEAATPLSAAGGNATASRLAVAPDGDAVLTWQRVDGGGHPIAEASTRPAGGEWSTPQALSPAGHYGSAPAVAIDAAGGAVAAWIQQAGTNVVDVATLSPEGSWSEPEVVSNPSVAAATPQVSLDPAGDAIVIWEKSGGSPRRWKRSDRTAGGSWSASETISGGEGFSTPQYPQVAQDRTAMPSPSGRSTKTRRATT